MTSILHNCIIDKKSHERNMNCSTSFRSWSEKCVSESLWLEIMWWGGWRWRRCCFQTDPDKPSEADSWLGSAGHIPVQPGTLCLSQWDNWNVNLLEKKTKNANMGFRLAAGTRLVHQLLTHLIGRFTNGLTVIVKHMDTLVMCGAQIQSTWLV